jgi:hypothetical protein
MVQRNTALTIGSMLKTCVSGISMLLNVTHGHIDVENFTMKKQGITI